jgi:protein SFI1
MSQRRILAADEDRDRHRNAISAVSVVSTGSSSTNLLPFEGLTHDEVAFVDSIINRVPSSATTFVPVFKAYQDEFEDRELNATDDQFYYNLLLKLGMIRADNWQARWSVVKEHFGYQLEAALEPDVLPEVPVASPRASLYRANFDEDDDAFTLHSHAESGGYAAPPSYASKRNRKIFDGAATSTQKTAPRQGSSVGRMLPRVHRPSSLAINITRHRLESVTTQSTQEEASQLEANSPTAAVPPSYHTYPQVAPEKPVRSSLTIRDDAETWRVIEMERNADMFRRDSLLSRCLEVWVQGLHWVEVSSPTFFLKHSISHSQSQTTTTRLDNARTEFILRSILVRWREKSATAIKETKRAASMDRVRLLNSSLSKWRLRAWTRRRKRWADEMRDRRIVMQNKVAKRQLAEFFTVSASLAI